MKSVQLKQKTDQRAIIRSLFDFAGNCRERGQYQQAESLYKRALALAEGVFGPDHVEISALLNNLAVLYKYTGNFDEAERLYLRALAIFERAYGPEHPKAITCRENYARLRSRVK